MKGTLSYLRNLAKDKNIASITPTSSFAVKRILNSMNFGKAKVIVEYGPGLGVFTKRILKRMRHDALLIAIEANPVFASELRKKFSDSRLTVLNESAENVLEILHSFGLEHADYIISGIPFSLFDNELKTRILRNTKYALGAGGRFLVYQFFVSWSGPKTDIKRKLAEHMEIIKSDYELFNIPPLRIYEAANAGSPSKHAVNY